MAFDQQLRLELIKLGITFLTVVVVGSGLTAYWAARQKRREIELLDLSKFYEYYGAFLTVLRMWNISKTYPAIDAPSDARWTLLEQSTKAEGGIESILVRLAAERRLTKRDQERLGQFRQSFQTLRESIKDDKVVEWAPSDHPEYVTFKEGASFLASLLTKRNWRRPSRKQTAKSLLEITSSKWEPKEQRRFP
jgi:hypothetical protein